MGVGAQHCPLGLHALWGLRATRLVGGRPRGGGVTCHRCEGRLVSGAVPPPSARPLERAARVPRPVCPGCGRCGRGDPAPAPQRAPLRAGVARCGNGGRASPGRVPFAVVRGVWGQALPLPRLPALWAGCRGPLRTCYGRGRAGVGALHRPRKVVGRNDPPVKNPREHSAAKQLWPNRDATTRFPARAWREGVLLLRAQREC